MVDIEGSISGVTRGVSKGFSATAEGMIYIILAALVIALLFVVFYMMSFKHKVRVRKIIRGRTVIIDDKAKVVKDKGGTVWWKLFKHRVKIPAPPSECVDLTVKGKFVTEFFRTPDESYIPITVDFDYNNFQKDHDDSFKPFPTSQRTLLVNELTESKSYLKKTFTDIIRDAIPIIAIVLILTVFMLFFGEVVEPTKDLAENLNSVANTMNKNLITMQDIVLERERFSASDGQGVVRDDVTKPKSSLLPD